MIPFNPWPGSIYKCSSDKTIKDFADEVCYNGGITATVRHARGQDILAACGQLKSNSMRLRKEKVNYRHVDTAAIHKTDELLTAWDLGGNYAVNSKLSVFSNINHGFQAPDIDRFFASVWDIDSAKLMFSSSASISNIYAVNYNVLRIMSGMGGLAYSS